MFTAIGMLRVSVTVAGIVADTRRAVTADVSEEVSIRPVRPW